MSKYNIIEKYPKGNDRNVTYNIKYQVDNKPDIYEVDMLYLGLQDTPKYVFLTIGRDDNARLQGKNVQYIDNNADREEFISEISKYQLGGSYRKTHPIIKSKTDELKDEISKYQDKISMLERELREVTELEKEKKFANYFKDIDLVGLDTCIEQIKAAFSSDKYYLMGIEYHIWEGYRVFICDRKTCKKVKAIIIKDDNLEFRDINVDDM